LCFTTFRSLIMDAFRQDVRFALRAFARRPAFALSAILSLGLGIAASSAVFSLINAALFKPVPGVTRPERLVEISRSVNGETSDVTWEVFSRFREERAILEDVSALALVSASIAGTNEPVARGGLAVTGNYFDLLGVRAARGRLFSPDEASWPAVAPVVVISHEAWQRDFNGRADVVGQVARVNGVPLEVIGVLPEGFGGHHTALLLDVFLPIGLAVPGLPSAQSLSTPNASSVEMLGRLVSGMSTDVAIARLSNVANQLQREGGGNLPDYLVDVSTWGPLPGAVRGGVAAFLSVLLLLVGLTLAMACANVATVLLARAVDRQRELAVRRAIGATRQRLVRQLVTEVSVLFAIAGVAGVLFATWATGLLAGFVPPIPIPGRLGADVGFDWRVAAFATFVTLGAAFIFNLLPALTATRFDVVSSLREAGGTDSRSRSRLRSVLVGAQVAVTCVLLFATTMFGRALDTMRSLRPQWNVDDVLVMSLDLELNGSSREAGMAFQTDVRNRVEALPGVEAASWATKLPIGGRSTMGPLRPSGGAPDASPVNLYGSFNRVSPGFFRTLQIPLLRGREFTDADRVDAPGVAILNETLARTLFGRTDVVGRRFSTGTGEYRREFEVVGIAGESRIGAPGQAPENFFYVPLAQMYNSAVHLHVRVKPGMGNEVAATARATLREVSTSLPLGPFRPMAEVLDVYLLPQRLASWVAAVMGAFGLILAGVGIYGVAAFAASRRSREVAIRMALGATDRDVTRLLVGRGARAPLIGMILGLLAGVGLSFGASTVVPGVQVGDPVAFIVVAFAITLISTLSLAMPVRVMLRNSPMSRLREE
jgi:putative ABC transport system permease protein